MDNMLVDLGGNCPPPIDEEPTSSAKAFYRMVSSADEIVHENTTHSRLSAVARLLALKSQYNMSIAEYDDVLQIIHELMLPGANLSKDFYQSKKLLEGLGMPYVKIDVCKNNCMLYYKDNEHKEKCEICGTSRYEEGQNKVPRKVLRYLPLKDRLQRLYAHEEIAKHMQSHSRSNSDKMVHPIDGEAWQGYDKEFPEFAEDRRNVRLVIAGDGFTPYKLNAAPYTCWPIFIAPLNLPPGILLKPEYIFLSLVIPGPEHPGKKLSALMQPLADELMQLWDGVETWDAYHKVNFPMKAAFLWSVHDFPAFGMFAGWSTHGKLACPECMSDSKAFTLQYGRKPCWFDCHRRFLPPDHEFRFQANSFRKDTIVLEGPPRCLTGEEVETHMYTHVNDTFNYNKLHNWTHISCFWQLPYFKKLKLRHNIDVMHNERNVAEAIFNTCFDIPDKTKDNVKARKDLAEICNRPSMHLKLKDNGKWDKPEGDRKFKYADPNSKHYKYNMQLGIILKREHPGIIEKKEGDIVIKTRPALEWFDYYDNDTLDDKGQTAADRVKEVFWNLFEIHVKDDEDLDKVEDDADRVLDNYAMKKVRDTMYQLCVDAVKFYFEKQGERLDDTSACSKELEYAQHLECRIPWFKEHAWPHLCAYWCSKTFKSLRKRGQESRFKSEDVAQNRGGSLSFVEARQILAEKYGPEKATTLNTYAVMKSGLKNWDGSGSTSTTLSGKAKKRFDDYSDLARAAHPDDWEQRELDGQILYESSGGIPHGRLAIADGAIKKADVISTSREKKLRPSTLAAHRRTVQENEELKRHNENLQRHNENLQHKALFKEMGKELPTELHQGASSQPHGTPNSSHMRPQATDDNTGDDDLGCKWWC
ncbi:uncharacterized protein LOC119321825 isoform X3 [Triticum dicoccoides]|uniref:uncharacterized protein LOC119321825 isoform X3 n=1 Tax=Triticum dicoccoides TaxID=85692 RepID=UPI0018915F47|nr:uncharacterized protein LOC119321825 isoform X3 [Triticum dicoccoides]